MIVKKFPLVVYSREEGSDVVYAEILNSLKVDLKMAQELVINRMEFTRNEKHYFILDLSNVKEITPEAKDFMQNPDTGLKNILGGALIARNPVANLIANIFTKTRKDFQARVFSGKKDALNWIEEQREKRQMAANLNS